MPIYIFMLLLGGITKTLVFKILIIKICIISNKKNYQELIK